MKKFFTSGKFGIKNKKIASILNAVLSWSFFVVSCCVALFVCFYAYDNNDFANAVDGPHSVGIVGYFDGKPVSQFNNVLYNGKSYSENVYYANSGEDVTVKFTLDTGYVMDKDDGGNFKIEVKGLAGAGTSSWIPSSDCKDLTDSSEASKLHHCKTIQVTVRNITESINIKVHLNYDKYRVKFTSDIENFNENGIIKDDIINIDCSKENNAEIENGEIYFKYAKSNIFKYSIALGSNYMVSPGSSIETYLGEISDGNKIEKDDDGFFSVTFDGNKIQQYKEYDIKIVVTGIEKKKTIRIETNGYENKSAPYIDVVGKIEGTDENIIFDSENGFCTSAPIENCKVILTIQSKPGYMFENDNSGEKVGYKGVSTDQWNWFKNLTIERVDNNNAHSPQKFTITIDVEEDTIVQINNILIDKYKIRFRSDDEKYNDENGFLKLYAKDKNLGVADIRLFGKTDVITDASMEWDYDTDYSFEIKSEGKYSMSGALQVYIGTKKIDESDSENDGWYTYSTKLDQDIIKEFYNENLNSEYIDITVKGIRENSINILFRTPPGYIGEFWNKVSSIDCKGSEDAGWHETGPVKKWDENSGGSKCVIRDVKIGSDKIATIKIKLDQWYKFIGEKNYEKLIYGNGGNFNFVSESLEKREKNAKMKNLEGYETWEGEDTSNAVAVFKIKISNNIKDRTALVRLNIIGYENDIIKGYDSCSIRFTNEEDGLTFTKVEKNEDGYSLSDSSSSDGKTFSDIEYGKENYFWVKTDDLKCTLGEKLGITNMQFVGGNITEGKVGSDSVEKIICVTINENSNNYYPGIPAQLKLNGIILNDRFAMIEGINTEMLKESDITESKKFESEVMFAGNKLAKITTIYNAPLSFIIKPSSGYSFQNIGNDDIKDVISIFKIIKNGTDVTGDLKNYIDETNLIEDDMTGEKFTFENLGNSLEIKIKNMSDNIYVRINSTPDKIPINFKQSEGIEYFKLDEGKVSDVLRGTVTIKKGEEYKFAVKVSDGYDSESFKVLSNNVELSNNDTLEQDGITYHICTLSNVDQYTTVSASAEKLKCKLTFKKPPVGAYYTKVGSDKEITDQFTEDGILYGSNFSFRVKLKDEYSQSKLIVKADGNEIQPLSGDTYTIYNITKDGTISIDDSINLNNYTVNFDSSDKAEYILEGNNGKIKNVEHGGSCKFKVRAKTGYKLGENIAVNCVGASGSETLTGKKISGSGSDAVYEYEIQNVKENKTISVSGVEDLFYNIKLQDVEGVTYINETGSVISGTHKIAYGKNFEFSVNVDDAYDDSIPGMFIVVNEGKSIGVSAQKLSSGKYVIPNITQDITVRVGNIRKNRYTVTFTKTEGIDYYDTNGKIITGDTEVEQNSSISFKVSLYPAYSDSKITVMLGDKAVTADSSGVYTLTGIDENKTVTVLGVEKSKEAELINTINSLPNPVTTLDDVNLVVEASKVYNSLSDEKKKIITNYDLLQKLQEQVKAFHHVSNNVRVEGVDWYLKLVAVPISSSTEICSRIYEKLNSEYILSLYDIYLWDTLNDKRHTLPTGTTAVISIPTPDMTYFNKPTGIHENDDGKIDYLSLTFDGGRTTFEAVTFSPFGVIANRSSTPGRSSLLDAVDANVDLIKDFALSSFGGNSSDKSGISESAVFDDKNSNSDLLIGSEDDIEGNISEKYKSRNNKVTARGSALRLILVLMIIVLIALALWILYKRRKEMKKSKNNKNS